VDRPRVERLALANLVEYVRLLGLRHPFDTGGPRPAGVSRDGERTEALLVGLLDDKLRQSLARVFRLLKIAHPREDLHRVHDAYLTEDRQMRANAAEFLAALLHRHDQAGCDSYCASPARSRGWRTRSSGPRPSSAARHRTPVRTRSPSLMRDRDAMLAGLARLHAAAVSGQSAHVAVDSLEIGPIDLALEGRPGLALGRPS